MDRDRLIFWVLLGAAGIALLSAGGVAVSYAWEESENGQKWAPALAAAEQQYGLPAGLLSRQAAAESSFESAVIDGTHPSSTDALGILQLEPEYFSSVRVPVPFTDADVEAQINQAAAEDARLYSVFGSWGQALAAYNWGQGNVANAGADPSLWPAVTQAYVSSILADVPQASA